jgi:hypothetical protein
LLSAWRFVGVSKALSPPTERTMLGREAILLP